MPESYNRAGALSYRSGFASNRGAGYPQNYRSYASPTSPGDDFELAQSHSVRSNSGADVAFHGAPQFKSPSLSSPAEKSRPSSEIDPLSETGSASEVRSAPEAGPIPALRIGGRRRICSRSRRTPDVRRIVNRRINYLRIGRLNLDRRLFVLCFGRDDLPSCGRQPAVITRLSAQPLDGIHHVRLLRQKRVAKVGCPANIATEKRPLRPEMRPEPGRSDPSPAAWPLQSMADLANLCSVEAIVGLR
jgi:hypothetical protein